MKLNQSEIHAIYNKLVFGDIAVLARLSGMSRSAVTRWLNGETFSPRIAQAAEKLFTDRENSARRLRETLNRT